ncbi:MAG: RDD family protein [Chloroflexota bacterium]
MYPEERLNIDTPENVIFGYEVVGIGSRFMAALVDTSLIVLLQIIVYVPMLLLFGEQLFEGESTWVVALFLLLSFIFLWGYYIFFEVLWIGQSPGKRWVGLRVICANGSPLTLTESIIRNLVRIVDFLPLAYGVGVVVMFIDGQSRRLGDIAASTLVIRDKETVTLSSLSQQNRTSDYVNPDGQIVAEVRAWPLHKLTPADVLLAENLLQRRTELANSQALAAQILQKYLLKMELPPESVSVGNKFPILAAIVYAYNQP